MVQREEFLGLTNIVFMPLFATTFYFPKPHRSATPVVIGSSRPASEGRRFMRVPGRSCFSLAIRSSALSRVAPVQTKHAVSFCTSPFVHQNTSEKTALPFNPRANPALNLVRFALWTPRDKAAQRRLALR
jgi:hypothetical protein